MSIARLSTHQVDALRDLVNDDANVTDVDVLEEPHSSIQATLWADGNDMPLRVVSISAGGSIRDRAPVAA